MFILNKYNVTAPVAPGAGAVVNVNPNVQTGASGDSAGNDIVTPIVATAVYDDQVIAKLVAITMNAASLGAANSFCYISVPLSQLGITGIRPVLAASLLGVYNPNSIEGGNNTPSFIGWVAGAATLSIHVVGSTLILKVPVASRALFNSKVAMVQLFYSNNPAA